MNQHTAIRHVSIIGDSISTFEGYNPDGYAVFYNNERQNKNGLTSVNDAWWAIVLNALNASLCVNNAYSGSTVSGEAFPAAISKERLNHLQTEDCAPDLILIYIGFNDFGRGITLRKKRKLFSFHKDIHVFEDAYDYLLKSVSARYPEAKIVCGTLMRTRMADAPGWPFPEQFGGIEFEAYNQIIRKVVTANGCLLADIGSLGIRYDTLDGSHPTADGHKTFADAWLRFLLQMNL